MRHAPATPPQSASVLHARTSRSPPPLRHSLETPSELLVRTQISPSLLLLYFSTVGGLVAFEACAARSVRLVGAAHLFADASDADDAAGLRFDEALVRSARDLAGVRSGRAPRSLRPPPRSHHRRRPRRSPSHRGSRRRRRRRRHSRGTAQLRRRLVRNGRMRLDRGLRFHRRRRRGRTRRTRRRRRVFLMRDAGQTPRTAVETRHFRRPPGIAGIR